MLASFDEAEDAVQETCLRAWHGRESFGGPGQYRARLYRIATLLAEVPWLQPYPDSRLTRWNRRRKRQKICLGWSRSTVACRMLMTYGARDDTCSSAGGGRLRSASSRSAGTDDTCSSADGGPMRSASSRSAGTCEGRDL
jgi:Sigma-70 region 2